MSVLDRLRSWGGANLVPLVLIPLAAALVWVGVWEVWLPTTPGGQTATNATTTVSSNTSAQPSLKVTTVRRSSRGAAPSRRSEVLALALVFLGLGAAVIAVFHDRIGSLELTRTGVKIDLTSAEQSGAAALVGRLAGAGAAPGTYARGLDRYIRTVASRRPALTGAEPALTAGQASALADAIADEIV
jgi:hypothetical protein